MTESLGDKLPGDKTQKADPCKNEYRCRSTFRYVRVLFRSQKAKVLEVLEVNL